MMPYCSLEDIKKAIPEENLIQITDDAGMGVVDNEKIDDAIGYAGQLIDGYLRGRYPVPLNPVPELIRRIAVDMAIFHLYARRFELDMPETMMQRRKECIRLLELIQQGKVLLGTETSQSPGRGYYKSNKTEDDRIFSKELLNQF